jgi:hypothetical protein
VREAREALGIPIDLRWKKIQAPILTRWGTVGLAASFVCDDDTMKIYKNIAQWTVNKFTSSSAKNKIASSILSLMEEPLILSDANLVHGFMNYYFNEPYCRFEKGDPALGNTLGFLSRHMFVRYFVMSSQLKHAMDGGWKTIKEFSVFAKFLNLTDDQKKFQHKKADQFMKLAHEAIKKHFSIWCNDLLFFGLFGENHTASTLANYLSGTKDGEQSRNNVVFSDFHQTSINLKNLRDFIDCECNDINMVRESFHIRKVTPLIEELQSGKDIWSNSYQGLWKDIFLRHYSSHATHTQMVESAVKDSNFCSKKGRPEELQTQVGQIRSGILRELNIDARKKQVEDKLMKDGKSFKEDNHPAKIRGFHKTETAISKTRSHANLLNEKYVLKKVVWERMKSLVTMKYSDERKSRKIAAL